MSSSHQAPSTGAVRGGIGPSTTSWCNRQGQHPGHHPGVLLRSAAALGLGLISLGLSSAAAAAVMGGARAVPYDQALGRTREAARAVLAGAGTESCLRGKLTNALLQMVASCEAAGQSNSLCELSNRAVVQPTWSKDFMEATARDVLGLINDRPLR